MNVLVVDDEADLRDSLRELFEYEGYSVATAADGEAGLMALERGPAPNVIVLDLLMPRLDGNEMYRRMQAHPAWSRIPVIVSTSDRRRAPSGVLVLEKPVDIGRLLRAVRQLGGRDAGPSA